MSLCQEPEKHSPMFDIFGCETPNREPLTLDPLPNIPGLFEEKAESGLTAAIVLQSETFLSARAQEQEIFKVGSTDLQLLQEPL